MVPWQGHKKEIREREETIADKEKRIYDLKKKNQEVRHHAALLGSISGRLLLYQVWYYVHLHDHRNEKTEKKGISRKLSLVP